jgi:hypothetical protein
MKESLVGRLLRLRGSPQLTERFGSFGWQPATGGLESDWCRRSSYDPRSYGERNCRGGSEARTIVN